MESYYHFAPANLRLPSSQSLPQKWLGLQALATTHGLLQVVKTEVSTFHVYFIWVVLIFPLCCPQCEHLEPLMLLWGNDKRWRSYRIRGQSLPLTEFQWEVLLNIQGLIDPDPCELLAALNYLLINLTSLLLSIDFLQAQPILCPGIQSLFSLASVQQMAEQKSTSGCDWGEAECESSTYCSTYCYTYCWCLIVISFSQHFSFHFLFIFIIYF
jgi:hypothetical protein